MRVGEQATVDEQDSLDPGIEGRAAIETLLLAAEELERDQRRKVERHDEGGPDPLCFPRRLYQVSALHRAVGILGWLVGVALPHVLDEELRRHAIAGQLLVHLRPAEGAVREARQERRPACVLDRLTATDNPPPDLNRSRRARLADLLGFRVVRDARPE